MTRKEVLADPDASVQGWIDHGATPEYAAWLTREQVYPRGFEAIG